MSVQLQTDRLVELRDVEHSRDERVVGSTCSFSQGDEGVKKGDHAVCDCGSIKVRASPCAMCRLDP